MNTKAHTTKTRAIGKEITELAALKNQLANYGYTKLSNNADRDIKKDRAKKKFKPYRKQS